MTHLERSLGENLPSSEHYLGLTNVRRIIIVPACVTVRALFCSLETRATLTQ